MTKQHLAKQLPNNKQTSVIRECGRRDGVNGSVRARLLVDFKDAANKNEENCCKQCLSIAKAKGLI